MSSTRSISKPAKSALLAVFWTGMLVLVAWVVTSMLPDPRPATPEAAASTVVSYFDRIESTIPEESVLQSSQSSIQRSCPAEEYGVQVDLERVIGIDTDLDRVRWAASLREELSSDEGWTVRIRTLDSRENLRVRVVGRELIVATVTAVESNGEAQITMRASSECTQPG